MTVREKISATVTALLMIPVAFVWLVVAYVMGVCTVFFLVSIIAAPCMIFDGNAEWLLAANAALCLLVGVAFYAFVLWAFTMLLIYGTRSIKKSFKKDAPETESGEG